MNSENIENAKYAAGKSAASLIQDGMLVGLGTGSTAAFFIEALIDRCKNEQLRIKAFPTSVQSAELARKGGIPLGDFNTLTYLDITVDGADEIDSKKRMIKGGGGALLREKILASISNEMVVIIDESKFVKNLGGFPLPIEIVPFAYQATLSKIHKLGYNASLRLLKNGQLFLTDNNNYIVDIKFPNQSLSPEKEQSILRAIPGVIETGFFFNLAGRIIIGKFDGSTEIIN